jgi:hypothetical protein
MIKAGHTGHARGLGDYEVVAAVYLDKPLDYQDQQGTKLSDHPLFAQIKWVDSGDLEIWITRYRQREGENPRFAGQFGAMLPEDSLVELLCKAISEGFFTPDGLSKLRQAISEWLKGAKEA